jgi:hypothetical protein
MGGNIALEDTPGGGLTAIVSMDVDHDPPTGRGPTTFS